MTKSFKVGDVVHWTSQSGGHTVTKQGVVSAVLPAGKPLASETAYIQPKGASLARLGTSPMATRDHASYIIRVRHSTYYWPQVKHLKRGKAPKALLTASEPSKTPEEVLRDLVRAIDDTGGLLTLRKGLVAPNADPDWTYMGLIYLAACRTLKHKPYVHPYDSQYERGLREEAHQ